jgi:hypothetical protein
MLRCDIRWHDGRSPNRAGLLETLFGLSGATAERKCRGGGGHDGGLGDGPRGRLESVAFLGLGEPLPQFGIH